MNTDIQAMYAKLAANEQPSEEEIVSLLKELEHFRGCTAYLASCEAATLEGLPKSASKSSRGRHAALCKTAAAMLDGMRSPNRYETNLQHARERCLRAAEECREV